MSIWTHVCGLIRFDAVPIVDLPSPEEIRRIFYTRVPYGSEGPLIIEVVRLGPNVSNPHPNIFVFDVLYANVYIYGDLRDFDDMEYIANWVKESCKKCVDRHLIIRQAVVDIECEYKHLILLYSDGKWKEITVQEKEYEKLRRCD